MRQSQITEVQSVTARTLLQSGSFHVPNRKDNKIEKGGKYAKGEKVETRSAKQNFAKNSS